MQHGIWSRANDNTDEHAATAGCSIASGLKAGLTLRVASAAVAEALR